MAATMPNQNTITMDATADKTSNIFPDGVNVDQITIVAGATPTLTTITADGVDLFDAIPSADSTTNVPLSGTILYGDIVATLIGTNVTCFVHVR